MALTKATSAGFREGTALGNHRAPVMINLYSENPVEIIKGSLRLQPASPAWCLLGLRAVVAGLVLVGSSLLWSMRILSVHIQDHHINFWQGLGPLLCAALNLHLKPRSSTSWDTSRGTKGAPRPITAGSAHYCHQLLTVLWDSLF